MSIPIGPYTRGEIPLPLTYQFLDSSGTPIDLTGFTAKFTYQRNGGSAATKNATITTAASGIVTYIWVSTDLDTTGIFTGHFWVGNNAAQRYASEDLVWRVKTVEAVPSI